MINLLIKNPPICRKVSASLSVVFTSLHLPIISLQISVCPLFIAILLIYNYTSFSSEINTHHNVKESDHNSLCYLQKLLCLLKVHRHWYAIVVRLFIICYLINKY